MSMRKLEELLSEIFASDSTKTEHLEKLKIINEKIKVLMEKEGVFLQLKDEKEQMLHYVRTKVHFTEGMFVECEAQFTLAKTMALIALMSRDPGTNPIEALSDVFGPIYSIILNGEFEYRKQSAAVAGVMSMFLRCMYAAHRVLAYLTNEAMFEIEYMERVLNEMEEENGV